MKPSRHSLTTLAATGLLSVTLALGQASSTQAQDAPPPPPPAGEQGAPPPPDDGGPGPKAGPERRGERPPHPPRPPRPDEEEEQAQPVDPQAAPVAVKTATDALAGLSAGQVWSRIMPRGEQQAQATLMFQNKEVARLDFDPLTGALQSRGLRPPPPARPRDDRRPPLRRSAPPVPGDATDRPKPDTAPVPPPTDATAPRPSAAPVNLDVIKAKMADTIKGLSVGQGAEIMPREGFGKCR